MGDDSGVTAETDPTALDGNNIEDPIYAKGTDFFDGSPSDLTLTDHGSEDSTNHTVDDDGDPNPVKNPTPYTTEDPNRTKRANTHKNKSRRHKRRKKRNKTSSTDKRKTNPHTLKHTLNMDTNSTHDKANPPTDTSDLDSDEQAKGLDLPAPTPIVPHPTRDVTELRPSELPGRRIRVWWSYPGVRGFWEGTIVEMITPKKYVVRYDTPTDDGDTDFEELLFGARPAKWEFID